MADEKKVLLKVEIEHSEAIAKLAETRKEIDLLKEKQKELDRTTEEGRKQYEAYGAEIRNLTNSAREQQKALDNNVKAERSQAESLDQLKAKLSTLTAEYNKLSKEQRNSADGQAMAKSIKEITDNLNEAEGALGNFRRRVGDYENSIKQAISSQIPFMKGIFEIGEGAEKAGSSFGEQAVGGVKAFGKALLSLLANPIVAIIAAIAAAIMLMVSAMKQNGEATEKVNQILAPFKMILDVVITAIGKFVNLILSGVTALISFGSKIASVIPFMDKMNEKTKESINLKKDEQSLAEDMRQDVVDDAKKELEVAELKQKSKRSDIYSAQERLDFVKKANAIELEMSNNKVDFANREFTNYQKWMEERKKTYKNLTADEKQKYVELEAAKYKAQKEYFDNTLRLSSQEASFNKEIENEKKQQEEEAKRKAEQAQQKAEQAAQKREEIAQRIAQAENQMYNLKANAELKSLQESAENTKLSYDERLKAISDYQEKQKALIDYNATFEKSKKDLTTAEIKLIDEKAKQDKLALTSDMNKKIEELNKEHIEKTLDDFAKQQEKQKQQNDNDYEEEHAKLLKQYDRGKITTEQYLEEKKKLQKKYTDLEFNQTLDNLEKQLAVENLTDEQRLEIQRAINEKRLEMKRRLNDEEYESTQNRIEKEKEAEERFAEIKKQLYEQLQQTIADITNGIFERRIQQLDEETQKVTESSELQKQAIDAKEKAGVISKETAENQKNAIDKKTKAEQDKLDAEKKREQRNQAIAEKLFATFSVGLSTTKAVMAALSPPPEGLGPIAGIPLSIATGAIGALQIASIMAKPIPKASLGILLNGKSHAQGGIPIEAEGGEAIINKRSTEMFKPLLSAINEAGGGVPFVSTNNRLSDGGYATRTYYYNGLTKKDIEDAMSNAMGALKIYATVEDIRREDKKYAEIEDRANF
jgi:hypothetical protein